MQFVGEYPHDCVLRTIRVFSYYAARCLFGHYANEPIASTCTTGEDILVSEVYCFFYNVQSIVDNVYALAKFYFVFYYVQSMILELLRTYSSSGRLVVVAFCLSVHGGVSWSDHSRYNKRVFSLAG